MWDEKVVGVRQVNCKSISRQIFLKKASAIVSLPVGHSIRLVFFLLNFLQNILQNHCLMPFGLLAFIKRTSAVSINFEGNLWKIYIEPELM